MDLRPPSLATPLTSAGLARRAAAPQDASQAVGQEAGFPGAFKTALQSVSAAQSRSADLQKQVQLEDPTVSLEETMVAIQKAQIGFQAALNVRNRMVQAYTDIMNMQV
ncbi:flagellar hook-basal body complex protein FliE [Verminephrobacter eiseniae]|uniref:flagellar hook-basal body complex protein FliE n=1 Tax=Verminephrobacter eiseniae TaxID=364317 RepID=UPI0010ECD833|nr:flagellar hook-basal body complex protein FliE [Verminephrobacter eiseniae]KAB7566331.1 flagellar hook-basal body complex protein FliE [Verminephrobacter sp. Larva24]MCW5233953.1 flagellar hook-basal body complex protein FliE [Verminephrobacter eiseniae]MCW5294491.1 flagellar hook-basal body complex protein FliE [Verminephrobacter eiseniae]MCW8187038.1 flagellar hook-basal body complex protein FliE [Verminephrobacter eiseniae]MCW8225429.1 flagellar hook-basal body complex protein FliE [Verm